MLSGQAVDKVWTKLFADVKQRYFIHVLTNQYKLNGIQKYAILN